jgi:hypothetical protein
MLSWAVCSSKWIPSQVPILRKKTKIFLEAVSFVFYSYATSRKVAGSSPDEVDFFN